MQILSPIPLVASSICWLSLLLYRRFLAWCSPICLFFVLTSCVFGDFSKNSYPVPISWRMLSMFLEEAFLAQCFVTCFIHTCYFLALVISKLMDRGPPFVCLYFKFPRNQIINVKPFLGHKGLTLWSKNVAIHSPCVFSSVTYKRLSLLSGEDTAYVGQGMFEQDSLENAGHGCSYVLASYVQGCHILLVGDDTQETIIKSINFREWVF